MTRLRGEEEVLFRHIMMLCFFCVAAAGMTGCVLETHRDGGVTLRPVHIGVY